MENCLHTSEKQEAHLLQLLERNRCALREKCTTPLRGRLATHHTGEITDLCQPGKDGNCFNEVLKLCGEGNWDYTELCALGGGRTRSSFTGRRGVMGGVRAGAAGERWSGGGVAWDGPASLCEWVKWGDVLDARQLGCNACHRCTAGVQSTGCARWDRSS